MATRYNYWTNSKFAAWIRRKFGASPKLKAGTAEEWRDWRKSFKTNRPFVYWLTEDFLDTLQDIVYWPHDKYDDLCCYIGNRFTTKTHYVPTKLKPGQWHETDERMLHGMFELLVDFIECEKAIHQHWSDQYHSETKTGWLKRITESHFLRCFFAFRSRELGLKHLAWEMTLAEPQVDEWGNDHSSPRQAASAKEQYELYVWWKDVRPNRPDPMDVSGWSALCDSLRNDEDGILSILCDNGTRNKEQERLIHEKMRELEEQYDKEDEEMLIRLIKIRHALWT